ncbi:hypothetical protein [Microtetraspora malaysiensis]|uniref:Uncharacterized protein n=1 Tax=Microtetraspora malaysiensis TaxID=161358 RepID=A0ABW6SQG5_9ACTN
MADWAKLIEAIAGLVGAVAWPTAIVLAVWLIMRRHRSAFERLIDRVKAVSYPGGQIDLTEIETQKQERVEELTQRAAAPEITEDERRETALKLAEEAEMLGAFRAERGLVDIGRDRPVWVPFGWLAEASQNPSLIDAALRRIRDYPARSAGSSVRSQRPSDGKASVS